MALPLGPIERARVWNSLDDNLRQQVREGRLSIEEAAEFVVPIGDREMQAMRAGPQMPQQSGPVGLDAELPAPDKQYDTGTALEVSGIRLGQAVDTLQAGGGLEAARLARQAREQRPLNIGGAVGRAITEPGALATAPTTAMAVGEAIGGEVADWVNAKLYKAIFDEEQLAAMERRGIQFTDKQIQELNTTRDRLAALPPNEATVSFIKNVNEGNYWEALKFLPAASYYTTIEQAPTMAAQLGVVGGTALATRSPAATRRAAGIAGALGGATEIGSDFESLLAEMPEADRNDPNKLWEAWKTARDAAGARTVIEALVPGSGLGKALPTRVATLVAGQMASEAGGEFAAATVKGQDVTTGELALEALAGAPQTAVESAVVIRQTRQEREDAEDARLAQVAQAQRDAQTQADQAIADLRGFYEMQDRAEANRAQFDAEVEAERAVEALRMQSPTQTEMPFGSDMAGDAQANDRTPSIVDMFSGQEMAATKAEDRRQANVAEREALARGEPNLTDEEFETRKQAEFKARGQIENRRQAEFEQQKERELGERRQRVEDETTLKQERQLLSTADITREAKRLVEVEKEGLRQTRRGIARTPEQMESMLAAYERKRLPELVENVRNRRLEQVNTARDRSIARENAELEKQPGPTEQETAAAAADRFNRSPRTFSNQPTAVSPGFRPENMGAPMTDLLPETQAGALGRVRSEGTMVEAPREPVREMEQGAGLFDEARGQGQLPLVGEQQEGGFTGQAMTEEQRARELAAGQLRRQVQTERDIPARRAAEEKAAKEAEAKDAEAIAAEIPTVAKALQTAENKKASLTAKTYAKKEKEALDAIVAEETGRADDARSKDQIVKDVARRMAEWRKANPKPQAVPEPSKKDAIRELAQKVAKDEETKQKTAETKNLTKQLRSLQKQGMTPEQAAEEVSNRLLTPEEDAALRAELGGTANADTALIQKTAPSGRAYVEESNLREVIDRELAQPRASISRVLEAIVNDPEANIGEKWLANKLIPILRASGVRLVPVSDNLQWANVGGAFVRNENAIWIRAATRETILHEALHAATSNLLATKAGMSNPIVKAAYDKLEQAMQVANMALASGDAKLTDITKERWGQATENVREFLAHGLTEQSFIRFLEGIEMPGQKQSVWQQFKAAVKSLFRPRNPQQNTVLDAVIEATGELLDNVQPSERFRANLAARGVNLVDTDKADLSELASPFTNPQTVRDYFQLGKGKVTIKFNKDWARRPVGSVLDVLSGGAGKSKKITEAIERGKSEAAALTSKAEQLYRATDYALMRLAQKNKTTTAQIRKEFLDAIDQFENINPSARLEKAKAIKGLRAKYGDAARAYFNMRRTIDSLSREILQQRLKDPTPFTQAEAKIYTSIKANLGRYYTRVYATNIKGVGDEYARRLWNEYMQGAAGSTDPEVQDGYQKVRDAIVWTKENLLVIPDNDTLETMPLPKLKRLAVAWGVESDIESDLDNPVDAESKRLGWIDSLNEMRSATEKRKDYQAMNIVQGMLFGKSGVLLNYYRGAKQDRTIVMERERMPTELRKLLGEYEDTPLRGMITIIKQGNFRSNNKAFMEILKEERGNRILDSEEFVTQGRSQEDWTRVSGAAYGILNGYWVRNDLYNRIKDSAEIARSFEELLNMANERPVQLMEAAAGATVRGWAKAASWIKMSQLVFNPANLFANFLGGPAIMISNGTYNPVHAKKALKVATDLVRSAKTGKGIISNEMERIIRAGITDSAFMGELKAVEMEQLRSYVLNELRSPVGRQVSNAWDSTRGLGRGFIETYAMADVVWKIANFYAEEARLKEVYDAEGIKLPAEQLERMAADRTNLTNFSYRRVPPMIKVLEKSGVMYIAPYVYETIRAPIAGIYMGLADIAEARKLSNPKARALMAAHGAKRTLGSLLVLGGLQQGAYMAMKLAAQALGAYDEEDEETIEAIKLGFLPEYKKEGFFVPAGRSEDGKLVLFEMSRFDPFGPASEMYQKMLSAEGPDDLLKAAADLVIFNPYGESILGALLGGGGTRTRMEESAPAIYDAIVGTADTVMSEDAAKRTAKVVDTLVPSWISRGYDPRNKGDAQNILTTLWTNFGGQVYQVDPLLAAQYRANAYNTTVGELKTELYSFLRRGPHTTNDILDKYTGLREDEQGAFESIEKYVHAGRAMGMSDEEIMAILKVKKLNDMDIAMAMTGGYSPAGSGVLSIKGLETSIVNNASNEATSATSLNRNVDNVINLLYLVETGQIPARE